MLYDVILTHFLKVGSVLGAPLGGFITDSLGWRFCFYINLPLLVVTIYVATKLLTNYNLEENPTGETLSNRLKKIDYTGTTTIVLAVVCFLMATSLGGNIMPWSALIALGCFASSIVLAITFCIIEASLLYIHLCLGRSFLVVLL